MPIYAAIYHYTDDTETRDALRAEHRDYLRGLAADGHVLLTGPFGAAEAPGALLLLRADDRDAAAALLAKDPFTVRGVVKETEIRAWDPVIGPLLDAL